MIVFEVLRYKNLLSTGNLFTTIELNKHASTLVVGKNGSGKSTILDAICFALFAKPFRNINKPQLVNSITKKNMLVELEFSIGKTKYKIIRGIKPAVFEVYQSDKLLNQTADQKDYQETLEKQILKLNYKSFRQIVILGSASFVPFMALTTGQRREIIEDLLDLQIFTTMNNLLKERVATNARCIGDLHQARDLTREKIDLHNQHLAQLKVNNEEFIANKHELMTDVIAEAAKLNLVVQNNNCLIKKLEDALTEESVQSKINKNDKIRHKAESRLSLLISETEFFLEHQDCPTCSQTISEEFRTNAIRVRHKEIDKIENGLEKLKVERELLEKKLEKENNIYEGISQLRNENIVKQNEIRLKNDYAAQIKNEIEQSKKKYEEYDGAKLSELTSELEKFEVEYQEALDDKQTFSSAGVLLKDSGIKAKIIKQYVPVINKLINKYLSALDFFVQFELNEAFEESIKSRYRDDFSYESFSEGEKKRINLAIIFTWRAIAKLRNSANTNLFMLDEVFDSSLDLTGMEEVLRLLLSLSADNTFIISHSQATVADKFDQTIRFEKRQNFSKVASNG